MQDDVICAMYTNPAFQRMCGSIQLMTLWAVGHNEFAYVSIDLVSDLQRFYHACEIKTWYPLSAIPSHPHACVNLL